MHSSARLVEGFVLRQRLESMCNYIAGTTTRTGLRVEAVLKRGGNEIGERVCDAQMRRCGVCAWIHILCVLNGVTPCDPAPYVQESLLKAKNLLRTTT